MKSIHDQHILSRIDLRDTWPLYGMKKCTWYSDLLHSFVGKVEIQNDTHQGNYCAKCTYKKRISNWGNGSVFHLGDEKCRPFRMDPDEAQRHSNSNLTNWGMDGSPPKKRSQIVATGRLRKNVDHSGWMGKVFRWSPEWILKNLDGIRIASFPLRDSEKSLKNPDRV